MNGYDLSATIVTLMDGQYIEAQQMQNNAPEQNGTILVGKSMKPTATLPIINSEQVRIGAVCKFWLSTGQCFRADCRYSHDLSNHICKYVYGSC